MTRSPGEPDPHRFMTVREIAAELRVSRATVYRLIESGRLPGKRFGALLRVPRVAVTTYIQRSGPDEPA